MPVGPRLEKFNIVSNDHGRMQKCNFCVSVGKTNFTDRHTTDTINSFRESVLVCKMQKFRAFISIPFHQASHQAMQVIAMVGRSENKPLQNAFKRI